MDPIFKRVVLKISGEALSGPKGAGIDIDMINQISKEVKELHNLGVQVSIVVGGEIFGVEDQLKKWIEPHLTI